MYCQQLTLSMEGGGEGEGEGEREGEREGKGKERGREERIWPDKIFPA